MAYRLSLLDKSPLATDESAEQALARTLDLAKRAEAWGFHRFWVAEHHNSPSLAGPSPEVLIAWILAQTHSLRVGAGGVMLQHYSPYKVAENFNLLASLAPGRVDLGIGKAPGGLPLSTRALQQGVNAAEKGDFAAQLAQLNHWLEARNAGESDELLATPLPSRPAQRFLLGASEGSARLAAELGWHFVFAAHLNGSERDLELALETYHQLSGGQRAIVAVQAIVAASPAEATLLAADLQHFRVINPHGQSVTVGTEAQAEAYVRQAGLTDYQIEPRQSATLKGTAAQVHAQLASLAKRHGIEEFIIDTPISEGVARLTSLALLAEYQPATTQVPA
ncbi:MsnO8 family LLM class oxidoreductase [Nissabacter sp. SGAir0207]|uniref:MsnO8 family LLM class oxidoreductase n=1 Tax=Nissabacter sp. SGAir0207 TaxID=2126321 RepID=UPI0010CD26FE|nr:MsnO8 family LLM class oxidoreductase [Nissabacter sp. SGAir0207]QCR38503.1 alkane 1-monooxygenase [Nissabacter sp. SGAir0207]